MYHQTHYYVTQESLRSPRRRGICRPIPYPPTCLICSCQETSFKPRHKRDSLCPRIHTPCNRYCYRGSKPWSTLFQAGIVWILPFTLCLAWSLDQVPSVHTFWFQILRSLLVMSLPVLSVQLGLLNIKHALPTQAASFYNAPHHILTFDTQPKVQNLALLLTKWALFLNSKPYFHL